MRTRQSTRLAVKTRKELANEYGVSIRTLYRWIKEENIDIPPGLIKPSTLKIIYRKFGQPDKS